jgi:hypothetical protein
MAWYPAASRTINGTSAGPYSGGPFKGVLHTTEGSGSSGAIAAFKSSGSWPHFLVGPEGVVWQFIDTVSAARALRNLAGGVETNRDSAIQIEIVGFAGQPTAHPPAQLDALRKLMRWVEATHGVKPVGPGRPFADRYGQTWLRFDNATWDSFDAWCGHCHVSEQDHWDPGAIDIAALLPSPPVPPPQPAPTSKEIEGVKITSGAITVDSLDDQGRGWIEVPSPLDRLMFLAAQGSAPARDGKYWPTVSCDVNDSGPVTVVTLTGAPRQATVIYWKALVEE